MDYALVVLPHLLRGALVTLGLVVASGVGILGVGLAAGLAKLAPGRLVRLPAALYVDLARSVPLLVQLFLIFFVLPELGVRLPVFWAGVLGLVLYYGAYEAEILRGGIQAIDRGQVEAAVALGMRPAQVMRRITLRQAVPVILPPTTSLFIGALKGSSQVAVIALPELLATGNGLAVSSGNFFTVYVLVAVLYLAMTYPLSYGVGALERRVRVT